MPIPFFGGGAYENEPKDNNDNQSSGNEGGGSGGNTHDQQPTQPSQPQTNEYGDVWMSDEEAGISSPGDESWVDTLSEFFRPPE